MSYKKKYIGGNTNVSLNSPTCSYNPNECDTHRKISNLKIQNASDSQYDKTPIPVEKPIVAQNEACNGLAAKECSSRDFKNTQNEYNDIMRESTGKRYGGGKIKNKSSVRKKNIVYTYMPSKKNKSHKKQNGGVPPNQQWNNPTQQSPPPTYNGGLYTGVPFNGPWGNIPQNPTTTNYINNNLRSANPPKESITMYPGTHRLGNNYFPMTGVSTYKSCNNLNWGPYEMKCTKHGGKIKSLKKRLNRLRKSHNS